MQIKPLKKMNKGTGLTVVNTRVAFHEPQDIAHRFETYAARYP